MQNMEIKRDIHLKRLIGSQHDGMVKVVTGVLKDENSLNL